MDGVVERDESDEVGYDGSSFEVEQKGKSEEVIIDDDGQIQLKFSNNDHSLLSPS